MLLLFARVLSAAIIDSGKRIETVLVDGFRREKVGFLSALLQSRYSAESWVAQNSRSSSSLLNCGIGLRLLFIYLSFLLALVSSRNYAYFVVPYYRYQGSRCQMAGLLQTPFFAACGGWKDEARTPRAPAKGYALCTPTSTRRLPDLATALLQMD